MSKTAIIIIVIVALIIIIVVYSMYRSAQAKALAAQQRLAYPTTTTTQKVNLSDAGSFLGGIIGGLSTNNSTASTSGQYTQAELDYMAAGKL